jgi:hypothetical protein
MDFDPTDYSVVVKNRAPLPKPWRWEIYCAGKRQPIKRSAVLYESRGEASLVGKCALAQLLQQIARRDSKFAQIVQVNSVPTSIPRR